MFEGWNKHRRKQLAENEWGTLSGGPQKLLLRQHSIISLAFELLFSTGVVLCNYCHLCNTFYVKYPFNIPNIEAINWMYYVPRPIYFVTQKALCSGELVSKIPWQSGCIMGWKREENISTHVVSSCVVNPFHKTPISHWNPTDLTENLNKQIGNEGQELACSSIYMLICSSLVLGPLSDSRLRQSNEFSWIYSTDHVEPIHAFTTEAIHHCVRPAMHWVQASIIVPFI